MTARTFVEQTLESGFRIRQDFRDSVRFVMFDTDLEQWRYATHGGTAFIVNYGGQCFGITCRHVLGDFEWRQLALTDTKFGGRTARLKAVYYPSNPSGHAAESDLLDIVVLGFADGIDSEFFKNTAYVLDKGTVGPSRDGHALMVNGIIKQSTVIDEKEIAPSFGLLEFVDDGPAKFDATLRHAKARFAKPEFSSVTVSAGRPFLI